MKSPTPSLPVREGESKITNPPQWGGFRRGFSSLRHFENLHILLWLMKDTCWLMEWKTLGMAMIVPTIGVAIAITIKTFRSDEFWINLAICFWITANSYWMCCEFFKHEELKYYAGFPFAFGFVCVGWFYARKFLRKTDAGV